MAWNERVIRKERTEEDPPRLRIIVAYWDDASPDIRVLKALVFRSDVTRAKILNDIDDMGSQVRQIYSGFTRISEGETFTQA